MKFEEIPAGTRFELELLNNSDEKTGYIYVSQLLEPIKDGSLPMVISTPIFEARLVFIPLSGKIRISFFHKKYGLMGFTATVEAKEIRGNLSILKVNARSELEKIQRRQHYRVDCLLPAEYKVLSTTSVNLESKAFSKTTVKNISGSGACIVTEVNIPEKSVLELQVHLDSGISIKAICIILRNQTIEVKKAKSYELGLHFVDISKKDQDAIIKFAFEQQRLLLKKDVL